MIALRDVLSYPPIWWSLRGSCTAPRWLKWIWLLQGGWCEWAGMCHGQYTQAAWAAGWLVPKLLMDSEHSPFTDITRRITSTRIWAIWEGKHLPVQLSFLAPSYWAVTVTHQIPVTSKIKDFSCGLSSPASPVRAFSCCRVLFALFAQLRMFQTLYFVLLSCLFWWCFEGNIVRSLFIGKLCFASWEATSTIHNLTHV